MRHEFVLMEERFELYSKNAKLRNTQIIGMRRFLATSTVLITFGTIASPPLTSIGAPGSIKSF